MLSAVVFYFLFLIRTALLPFLYAAIIVYLARPFVEALVERRFPRIVAVLVAYFLVFAMLTLLIVFVIPILIVQLTELIALLPDAFETGKNYFSEFRIKLPHELDGVIAELQDRAGKLAVGLASGLPETAVGFFGGFFNVVIAWLLAFYLLKDMPVIKQTVLELIPEQYQKNVKHVFREVDTAVGGYLRGQVIVAASVGLMIMVWLAVLGVDFAFLLGLLAAVLNIIPYFGAIVAGVAAAIVASFDSTEQAVIVVIGMLVIQQIEGIIISPIVMRHTVDLHPTLVVFSLMVGGALFGFLGLLFAIPVAAALKAIVLHYVFAKPVEIDEELA